VITSILNEADSKMDKSVEATREEFAAIRAGRAHPSMFSKFLVDYYGTPTPLGQLASLQNQDARTLVVTPYDKSALKEIEKAIVNFPNLGANPSNDGTIIRVTMPELTEDRRKEYVKIVKGKAEDCKVSIRNIRRKAKDDLDALKSEVGDDEVARAEKELEALTKRHTDAADEALKKKEAELLEV